MMLEAAAIGQRRFLRSEEAHLNHLFDNKLVEEFIRAVDELEARDGVSSEARLIRDSFRDVLAKTESARCKMVMAKDASWKVNRLDPQSSVSVRVSGTNVELCYEGVLKLGIENICVMIYQAGLFDRWVPFCKAAEELQELSPLEKTVFLSFKLPFLTERYAYFYGLGIDRIDSNGTIVIYGEGITEQPELMKRYGVDPSKRDTSKLVVLDLKFFIC